MDDIYAVIWCDFVPLSLKFATAEEAMEKARYMRDRVAAMGRFMDIRAVILKPDDTLIDLLPREVMP